MSPRTSPTAAAAELARRDPVMAVLVAEAGPIRLRRPQESHFAALVRAIVYQQLAGNAAGAIHGRLVAALAGDVEPAALLALTVETMRGVGLSANKTASLRDLAQKVLDGTVVLDSRGLARESDQEVIDRLTTVRGIGEWTAHMFLLFQLRRMDIWPTGDFGVRKGYSLAWGIPMPTARELAPLGDPFRPYRSVAAWYCWRANEVFAGAADSALTRVKRLLFVHHTVSPATHALYLAAMEGVGDPALAEVDVTVRPALSATATEVLESDGYLIGSPANLGYISGAVKHFFDQIYYPCLEATQRRPFGAYVHANSDAGGALRALTSITTGLHWRPAQAPVVVAGEPDSSDLAAVKELASAVAAGLLLGD